MKYVFLGLFFLTACSPSTEKPVANTALEKNSFEHLSPKAYLEILEDSLYNTQADLSKAAPAFVRSENWEAGFLIYEHQAFEGQKTGFLTVWEAQDHDLVMKIENKVGKSEHTSLLNLYRFRKEEYEEIDTKTLLTKIATVAKQKSQLVQSEHPSPDFESNWLVSLPDHPKKPLVLEVSIVCFWSEKGKRQDFLLAIGNLVFENNEIVFKEK